LGLREALRRDGRRALEELFNDSSWRVEEDQTRPGEKCYAARTTTVDTLFGPLCLRRNYYTDGQGGGRAPLDEALGVVEGCTPALARLMCRAGAVEHLELLAETLSGEKTDAAKTQWEQWAKVLKEQPDGLEIVLREARQALPRRGNRREAALKQIAFFESNTNKMRYAEYQARGLFLGSGVIEAGCKTVIGLRLKQSGMFWGVTGAQNVLDIRSLLENRQFGPFWEQYRKPLPKAA
jgi:hypothetical protein